MDGQEIPTDIKEIGNYMRRGNLTTLTPWTIDSIPRAPQSEILIYLKLLMEEHIVALKGPYDYRDHAWGDPERGPLAPLRRYQQTSIIMKTMGWQFVGSDSALHWAKAPRRERFRARLKVAYAAHSRTVTLAPKERPFDIAATINDGQVTRGNNHT